MPNVEITQEQVQAFVTAIISLQRYEMDSNGGGDSFGSVSFMDKASDGDYVEWEDIQAALKIFQS